MAIPLVITVGAWGARLLGMTKIASVLFVLVKAYWLISLIAMAVWIAIAYFAKELLVWLSEFLLKLVSLAIDAAGVQNPGPDIVYLVNSLPPVMLDLWARIGLWEAVAFLFSCFATNMALRCIPFVGGIFKG